ncbi:hypothetical protein ACTJKW_22425, partial [Serratia marcescens]|uniref:hypothetical protein n=1 Tax=Serratia marcescens TaxID=615 RepID=UPI003F825261
GIPIRYIGVGEGIEDLRPFKADDFIAPCGVHAHQHDIARRSSIPVSDENAFWGAFGCSCFSF